MQRIVVNFFRLNPKKNLSGFFRKKTNMKFFILLLISFGILLNYCLTVNCENNDTIFIPTNEWQIVKKGQPLPRGLHISHNLTSGITKAKLMDNNNSINIENKESQLLAMPHLNAVDEDNLTIPIDELKEKLKKIKLDADQPFNNEVIIFTFPVKFIFNFSINICYLFFI